MNATRSAWLGILLAAPVVLGGAPPEPPAEDEKAIRATVSAFVGAFDKGDAKAVAALFTEGAEAVDHEGNAIRGRKALEAHYADRFASAPGDKIEATPESIHLLSTGLARLDGRTRLIPADGTPPATSRHSSTLARVDGAWKIAAIREVQDESTGHHERLEGLAWLVGEWVEESGPAVISTSIAWSEDGNFLLRSFQVRAQGRATLKGSQRIGWDPLTRQIKSWTFDSRGGHGEGYWVRAGDRWTVRSTGVRPDGVATSATQVLVREPGDRLLWKSIERVVGGEPAEDLEEVVMVRKPPEPK